MTFRSTIIIPAGVILGGLIGWVIFPLALYSTAPQPLRFSHKIHTGEQAGMSCDACHAFSDDGRFLGIPSERKCAECHSAAIGSTGDEATLVNTYITPGRPLPWKVYSRMPDNAYFSHAAHVRNAGLKCEECHGPHGSSDSLRTYAANRITGESRDIWGRSISGVPAQPWETMKMSRCVRCHEDHGHTGGCLECHK
jgi:hypothetical protein